MSSPYFSKSCWMKPFCIITMPSPLAKKVNREATMQAFISLRISSEVSEACFLNLTRIPSVWFSKVFTNLEVFWFSEKFWEPCFNRETTLSKDSSASFFRIYSWVSSCFCWTSFPASFYVLSLSCCCSVCKLEMVFLRGSWIWRLKAVWNSLKVRYWPDSKAWEIWGHLSRSLSKRFLKNSKSRFGFSKFACRKLLKCASKREFRQLNSFSVEVGWLLVARSLTNFLSKIWACSWSAWVKPLWLREMFSSEKLSRRLISWRKTFCFSLHTVLKFSLNSEKMCTSVSREFENS